MFINFKNIFEEGKFQIPVTYSLTMQGQDRNGGSWGGEGVLGMGMRGDICYGTGFLCWKGGKKGIEFDGSKLGKFKNKFHKRQYLNYNI